jgi:DNA-binding NarL/FixJ family response regulator
MSKSSATKKRILIVEDHPLFRAMLVQLINQQPGMMVCGEAEEISTALILIGQTFPDVIIADLMFSGPGGLDLLQDLQARNIQIPAFVLSMHEEKFYAEQALRYGAKGYVTKQESPATVVAAIRTILAGGSYFSERVNPCLEGTGQVESTALSSKVELLSEREKEILQLVGCSFDSAEIAAQLHLTLDEVDDCRTRIREKLQLKNAAGLYQCAVQWIAGAACKSRSESIATTEVKGRKSDQVET